VASSGNRRQRRFPFFAAVLLLGGVGAAQSGDGAGVIFPETAFDFGRVVRGALIEHAFIVRNEGTSPVRVLRASMTPPLLATRMPGVISPGTTAHITTRLDTTQLQGAFQGELLVHLDDPARPEVALSFEGEVVSTVEVAPMVAVFVVGQRGRGASSSVELINHEAEPLQILDVQHAH
jgi:Protein of unknown function (DUF1573)